jgi:hypothetical protein
MNVCKCVLTGDQVPPPYPILDVHVPERPLLMFALVPAAALLPSVFFALQPKLDLWRRSGQLLRVVEDSCNWKSFSTA